MTTSVPDLKQRQRALNPESSFIVQAPAGSGKTELLVRRYLSLLGGVKEPEEILAITFTNKAAAEMKHRVQKYLAMGKDHTQADDTDLMPILRRCSQRDHDRNWQLRHNPGRLRIMTLDGFSRHLVSQMPVTSASGIPSPPTDLPDALYRQAAELALAHLETDSGDRGDAIATVMSHLQTDTRKVVSLLVDMLGKRDQWLRLLPIGIEPAKLRKLLEDQWRIRLDNERADFAGARLGVSWNRLCRALDYAASNLDEKHPLQIWRTLSPISPATADIRHWQSLRALVLTGKHRPRQSFTKRDGFPAANKQETQDHLEPVTALAGQLDEEPGLLELFQRLPKVADPGFSESEWSIIQAANELLPLAVAELRVLFRETGTTDFVEIALGAEQALGDDDNPTDLAMALDYRIQHILVDEFQDTAWGQYKLLCRLVADWQPGDGRTLFAVGDPMQSIYRFRKAEVGIFLHAWEHGIGNLPLEAVTLTTNFRSDPTVVHWVNRTFDQLFPPRPDRLRGGIPYSSSLAYREANAGAQVRLHPFVDGEPDGVSRQVLECARSALQNPVNRSVAILVRSRADLARLTPALRRAGILYTAVEIDPLGHRLVIRDLLSLCRIMISPADDVAWLSLLRSPVCGLELAQIHALRGPGDSSLWQSLEQASGNNRLDNETRQRLSLLWQGFQQAWSSRGQSRFRDEVERLWERLCMDRVLDATEQENAAVFFELLDQLGPAQPALGEINERLAMLWARPENAEARLQLMTIHKAKGLEWDVVILPELQRKPRADSRHFMMWQELTDGNFQDLLLQAPIPSPLEHSHHSEKYNYLNDLEKEKSRFEALRLLYVACTRARRELHLLGRVESNDKGLRAPDRSSFLGHFWPLVQGQFEQVEICAGVDTPEVATPPLLQRLPLATIIQQAVSSTGETRIDDAANQDRVEYSWAGEVARRTGTVLHRVLQHIALEGLPAWQGHAFEQQRAWIEFLFRSEGIQGPALAPAMARCERMLENLGGDECFNWIIDPSHRQRRFEWPLVHHGPAGAQTLVMDCSFIDKDDKRWIVDFKTGEHGGAQVDEFLDREMIRYRPQLTGYADALAARGERNIHLGLFFPLLGAWRQWQYDGNP